MIEATTAKACMLICLEVQAKNTNDFLNVSLSFATTVALSELLVDVIIQARNHG